MTKRQAKRHWLLALEMIITKDDDLMPDELDLDGPDYKAWDAARNELAREFARRSRLANP